MVCRERGQVPFILPRGGRVVCRERGQVPFILPRGGRVVCREKGQVPFILLRGVRVVCRDKDRYHLYYSGVADWFPEIRAGSFYITQGW